MPAKEMVVALLAFGVFGVMSGILWRTHAAEGQPDQSEASPPNEETEMGLLTR